MAARDHWEGVRDQCPVAPRSHLGGVRWSLLCWFLWVPRLHVLFQKIDILSFLLVVWWFFFDSHLKMVPSSPSRKDWLACCLLEGPFKGQIPVSVTLTLRLHHDCGHAQSAKMIRGIGLLRTWNSSLARVHLWSGKQWFVAGPPVLPALTTWLRATLEWSYSGAMIKLFKIEKNKYYWL